MQNKCEPPANAARLPVIALRGMVVFPETVVHFEAGRDKSVAALNAAMEADHRLFVVAQRVATEDEPGVEALYTMGTIVLIKQVLQLPDGVARILVEGQSRAILTGAYNTGDALFGEVYEVPEAKTGADGDAQAYIRVAKKLFDKLAKARGDISSELKQAVEGERDPGALSDVLAANVIGDIKDRQAILECRDAGERVKLLAEILGRELDLCELEKDIQRRVNERIERNNHEYYLREQLHVIEEELGDSDDDEALYQARLDSSAMVGEARERTERELKRLKRMGLNSPESAVSLNYIETMLDLPWGKLDAGDIDIARARSVLEADHYALEDVKKRILEFLAVRSIKSDAKGPILCLVGAPGVGKTSIAKSVARALKRKFCQVSLGGVHDEAEIRGHRRTYVASMPGRVISAIKQCGSMNPVFLFDEIDKMASDMRGDPAAAMLEVLDPEQNASYRDHFLEAPFDLSHVLFITTANSAEAIPRPLYDRMEIIEVPSYTQEEKLQIAKRHLWKKQLKENGMNGRALRIADEAIKRVIDGYTREAGVRALERALGAICRKAAVNMLETPEEARKLVTVRPDDVKAYLGAQKFSRSALDKLPEVGVVNGLAWTSAGGEVMPVEVAVLPGDGALEMTGSLGDVMKESARIAWSFVRTQMGAMGVPEDFRKKHDIHIHVPEGATPKDGPSAGIAMACAMVSAVTGLKARQDIAMTGEISLRGKALPIGGVKEKLLAAYRAGVRTVLLPAENEKDLEELPQDVLGELKIRTIADAGEAISLALPDRSAAAVKAVG